MEYALIFAVACGVAVLSTPIGRWLSFRWGAVAIPDQRRHHQGHIPRLGGILLIAGYFAAIAHIYLIYPPQNEDDAFRLNGVVLGTVVVFIGGLIDDKFDLSFKWQLLIQIVGAIIANSHIVFLERFANPFYGKMIIPAWSHAPEVIFPTWLAWGITLFWIVGMINAVNWLDGLDGLAAGVGLIAALIFGWHAYTLGQTTVAAFPLALAGALLGFLFFNSAPARIFLGSAGVYLLAYNLATLALLAPAKMATALLVLSVPLLDGVWRIIDRLRQGRNPFSGDRGHLHFLLSDRGWPVRVIVSLYYGIALACGLVALFAPTRFSKLVIISVIGIALLTFLIWYGQRSESTTEPKT